MLKKLGIDSLLLFFVLSIAFLWLAFPSIQESIFGQTKNTISSLSVDDQVKFPEQGGYEKGEIRLNNDNLTLLYSRNGGDDFVVADDGLININDFSNEAIIYKSTSIRWRHPKGGFPELKNIIVKVRDEDKKTESKPKVLTYFKRGICDYNSLVNITISEDDLFDWEKGLMIYGEESSHDEGFQKDWWYRTANFASRGSEWGRAVTVQFFQDSQNDKLNFEYNCEMKISGNATRYFPQKSLKFKILDEQGKPTKVPLFDSDPTHKSEQATSFLLRQGGNDNSRTLFADLLMHRLASGSEVAILKGVSRSVFINGNYWGEYNVRQRIDPLMIAELEGVKEKNVTILYCEVYGDRSILKAGSKKQKIRFDSLIQSLPEKIIDKSDYELVKDQISIKSFIDYIIFETYFANQDWLHNNTTWYKAADKKWKWILNDLDYSLAYPGTGNVNANLFDKLLTKNSITSQLFSSLIAYPKFNERFKNRVTEILADELAAKTISTRCASVKRNYSEGIDRQIRRWRFIDSIEQWEKDCAENETFLLERRTIYQKQVQAL
ncbi:MAG: hypothetical protein GQ574_09205 [Crocinitomix sp.]|nr:hypothetical protein [Crocinitomix sp.]